jgi:hypothetical protein
VADPYNIILIFGMGFITQKYFRRLIDLDSNSQGTLDLDTKHYISVYLFIYFCIIIPSKPRITIIRFENLLIAMVTFH